RGENLRAKARDVEGQLLVGDRNGVVNHRVELDVNAGLSQGVHRDEGRARPSAAERAGARRGASRDAKGDSVVRSPAEVAARGTPDETGDQELALQQRSEEHTSELQSRENLVCRLLLE